MLVSENKEHLRRLLINFYNIWDFNRNDHPNMSIGVFVDKFIDSEVAMEEGMAQYIASLNHIAAKNKRLLKHIKSFKGKTFFKRLQELLKECEASTDTEWEIVRVTKGTFQDERYGRQIAGYYVNQWSVGESGDSFEGYIYVELKKDRYLKFFYRM